MDNQFDGGMADAGESCRLIGRQRSSNKVASSISGEIARQRFKELTNSPVTNIGVGQPALSKNGHDPVSPIAHP